MRSPVAQVQMTFDLKAAAAKAPADGKAPTDAKAPADAKAPDAKAPKGKGA